MLLRQRPLQRKGDDKLGALFQGALHFNVTAVRFHDALRQRQTQACSLPFRREEGAKNTGKLLRWNAASGIADAHQHAVLQRGDGKMYLSGAVNGLNRIQEQVHQDLLHLGAVVLHRRQLGSAMKLDGDGLGNHVLPGQMHRVLDRRAQIRRGEMGRFRPRIIEQLIQDLLNALHFPLHVAPHLRARAIGRQIAANDLDHPGNAGQRVADFMRQTRSQFAQGGQVFGAGHLRLVQAADFFLGFPDLLHHRVKVPAQVANLIVAPGKTGGHVQVAFAQEGDFLLKFRQGPVHQNRQAHQQGRTDCYRTPRGYQEHNLPLMPLIQRQADPKEQEHPGDKNDGNGQRGFDSPFHDCGRQQPGGRLFPMLTFSFLRGALVETFVAEMKRYLGFSADDAARLRRLGPRMEKYLPELSERFYSQIPHHPSAFRVFTGGAAQIERLKGTLRHWAAGLFTGVYDDRFAQERFLIGYRHVRIGLEQKYVISAMGIVRSFLNECLLLEFPATDERLRFASSLNKILDLDLNLMCESYMHATVENLRTLNVQLERANRELVESSHAKDEFLAQTSHELRTPLNSILGFTKLILDGLTCSREEEHELLRDVFSSAQHLLGVVNDILDIGRIEAGKMALHLEAVDPRAILDSTLPLLAMQAANKGLLLNDETLALRLPRVLADEVRFRQVLLNLLQNAVKFTAKGSVVLRASVTESMLRLEVWDTGIGVPIDKQEAVFQKFVQGDAVQARKHGGTGLGLTISRRLVELMGGQIGLSSEGEGRGTCVWFTLPLAEGSKESPS